MAARSVRVDTFAGPDSGFTSELHGEEPVGKKLTPPVSPFLTLTGGRTARWVRRELLRGGRFGCGAAELLGCCGPVLGCEMGRTSLAAGACCRSG